MKKEFNITGLCNPKMHYMADVSDKVDKIIALIEKGKYFTINRPHQYGKTTIQIAVAHKINKSNDSIALDISFEAIDYEIYQSKELFINAFLRRLVKGFTDYSHPELAEFVSNEMSKINKAIVTK